MQHLLLVFVCIFCYTYASGSKYCYTSNKCKHIMSELECINNNCQCSENRILSSDQSKCLRKVNGFGDLCEDNNQCSEILLSGGACINTVCKCKTGYHYKQGRCYKSVDLNEECETNEECFSAYEYVGLQCKNYKCKCRPNYYQRLDSGCRRNRAIGESCNLDSDCPKGITCDNMVCSNSNTTRREFSNPFELPKVYESDAHEQTELGSKCETNCENLENAICLDNFCACKPAERIASEDNKHCLPLTRGKVKDIRNSTCEESAQCAVFGGNSFCKNAKCSCKGGFYWDVNTQFCWVSKHVGEICKYTADCHPSRRNAQCINNVCTCMQGYHQKGTNCEAVALKVGDFCEDDHECLFQHSFCNESNVCTCKENYYAQKGKCVGGVKSSCETDADCCHLRNTNCRSFSPSSWLCLCMNGYTSSDDGKYCLPVTKYGEACEESFQCKEDLGEFGECREGVCRCNKETHYAHRKCHINKFFKDPCRKAYECYSGNETNSVICLNGFCSCNDGYKPGRLGFCVKTNSASLVVPYFYVLSAALFFSTRKKRNLL